MSNFQSAEVDFDLAREALRGIKLSLDGISAAVDKATQAMVITSETNTMGTLQNVIGGYTVLDATVKELPDLGEQALRDLDKYQEEYEAMDNESKMDALYD